MKMAFLKFCLGRYSVNIYELSLRRGGHKSFKESRWDLVGPQLLRLFRLYERGIGVHSRRVISALLSFLISEPQFYF